MTADVAVIAEKLIESGSLTADEAVFLMENRGHVRKLLSEKARAAADSIYGKKVFIRGLIEFTNFCRNDCFYCGIRRSNSSCDRYRLTAAQILDCCSSGYDLGYRTFVLQGGEDFHYSDEDIASIVSSIKNLYPDCAVTLSVGERSRKTYAMWRNAGADRYLLRHETASDSHYLKLHPSEMSLENRKRCLYDLKELGYQTGAGFMVGSPFQTLEHIAEDLAFLKELQPEMIGIGPFIHHDKTPFAGYADGTAEMTLFLISVLRLMFPKALIPATTALGTILHDGREQGILCGANVIMPNLSPLAVRKKYDLYESKICTGEEAAECRMCLERRISSTGYEIVTDRGDFADIAF